MSGPEDELEEAVGRKAERRERARQEGRHTVWFGFGMFGLVGWAVAVPALAGVALGHWLDTRLRRRVPPGRLRDLWPAWALAV